MGSQPVTISGAATKPETGSASAIPAEYVYASPGGVDLKAYVFFPRKRETAEPRAAIVLFHGGGWSMGEPQWGFSGARHFAERGLVAVAVQYRLSNEKAGVTPLEAMADAKAALRWTRENAASLGIDPERIAAYGWSAGGHLAASAAIFHDAGSDRRPSPSPNALVLISPAVSLGQDRWVARLLGGRAKASEISPDEHVRPGLPPTLILQGSRDTVTPLPGVQRFCERLRAAGNRCEIHVYDGFGHLFTPPGVPDADWPKPDPATQEDALARADRFLKSLGFMD
jgi:acetyl esterase/lipase